MDKKTLSHYGWVVVLTLVLAIMLAFATPFGTYVGDGVVNVVTALFGMQNDALDSDNIKDKSDKYSEELNKVQVEIVDGVTCEHKNTILINVKDPTCKNEGYSGDYHCNDCDEIAVYGQAIPRTEHLNIETVNAIAGSCTSKGFSGNKVCRDCDTIVEKGEYTKGNAHVPEYTPLSSSHTKCSVCGVTLETEHTFTKTITRTPTCQKMGESTYTCICGLTYTDYDIPLTAHKAIYGGTKDIHEKCEWCNATISNQHSYKNTTLAAGTCINEGVTKRTCDCGYSYTINSGKNANNHEGKIVKVGTADRHERWDCCDKNYGSHSYTTTTTLNATCTTTGTKKHSCNCGYSYTSSIAALGHNLTENYLNVDYVAYYDCSRCNDKIIPTGASYYVKPTATSLNSYTGATKTLIGDGKTVVFPTTVNNGDAYNYNGYEYRYNQSYSVSSNKWSSNSINGWSARVLSSDETTYPTPLKSIASKNLVNLKETYYACTEMTTAPEIPTTVKSMSTTYAYCQSLTDAGLPTIPNGVTTLYLSFAHCPQITKSPNIPNTVTDVGAMFVNCTSLKEAPIFPDNIKSLSQTFQGCTSLVTYAGSTDTNGDFSGYKLPSNLTSLHNTFNNCDSMLTAPVIPATVTNMHTTFYSCDNIGGFINVDNNLTDYDRCFVYTKNKIYLLGSSGQLAGLASTDNYADFSNKDNVRVVVDNPLPENSIYRVATKTSDGYYGGTVKTFYGDGLTVPWPTPSQYDMYTEGEYNYTYESYYNVDPETSRWDDVLLNELLDNSWTFHVVDTTKTQYGVAKDNVNGIKVKSARSAYRECVNMVTAPELPNGIIQLQTTYQDCIVLQNVPTLSDDIIMLGAAFNGCVSLTTIPNIPNSITAMYALFKDCTSLTSIPRIPENCRAFELAFYNCINLEGYIEITAPMNYDDYVDYPYVDTGAIQCGIWSWAFEGTSKKIYLYGDCDNRILQKLADSDTYNDFSDLDNVRVLADNLIPEGAIYYVQPTSMAMNTYTGYSARYVGDGKTVTYPTLQKGDVMVYGDYAYKYMYFAGIDDNSNLQWEYSGWDGWGVRVVDSTKSTYPSIHKMKINGKDIVNLNRTYANCYNLTGFAADYTIPESTTVLQYTFANCIALETIPESFAVSDNVELMLGMFRSCTALNSLPSTFRISNKVEDMSLMFYKCNSLKELPDNFVIPDGVTNLYATFDQCTALTHLPDGFKLPSNLQNMRSTFYECDSLYEIPKNCVVPATVTNMYATFFGCNVLTNTIKIDANPSDDYRYCFGGDINNRIDIYGASLLLDEIAFTDGYKDYTDNDKVRVTGYYYTGVKTMGMFPANPVKGVDYTEVYTCESEFPTELHENDVYIYGDYEYRYGTTYFTNSTATDTKDLTPNSFNTNDKFPVGMRDTDVWSVRVRNNEKTKYYDILDNINGKKVTNLSYTFAQCNKLTKAPKISQNAVSLMGTFHECKALTDISDVVIPEGAIMLRSMFNECTALTSTSSIVIPSTATDVRYMFLDCVKITGTVTINGNPSKYTSMFEGTQKTIKLAGPCSGTIKAAIISSSKNNKIVII